MRNIESMVLLQDRGLSITGMGDFDFVTWAAGEGGKLWQLLFRKLVRVGTFSTGPAQYSPFSPISN